MFDLLDPDGFTRMWQARDEAVWKGWPTFTPELLDTLTAMGPDLWAVVDALPVVGRVLFGAHLDMPRPADPSLSGWHAVNCLREWRGDTHWALVVAAGLTHAEASILHNAWLGYEDDWLARPGEPPPRPSRPDGAPWRRRDWPWTVPSPPTGSHCASAIEDDTDRLTSLPWELLGRGALDRVRRALRAGVRGTPPTGGRDRRAQLPARLAGAGTAMTVLRPGRAGPRDGRHPGHRAGHRAGAGRNRAGTWPSTGRTARRGEGRDDSDTGAGRPLPGQPGGDR